MIPRALTATAVLAPALLVRDCADPTPERRVRGRQGVLVRDPPDTASGPGRSRVPGLRLTCEEGQFPPTGMTGQRNSLAG